MARPLPVRRVTLADIVPLARYDAEHAALRRRMLDVKAARRVDLETDVFLVFETFETVLYQVQEALRAGRVKDPERVQLEIDLYNQLLPRPGELTATLFVEADVPAARRKLAPKLGRLDRALSLWSDETQLAVSERVETFSPAESDPPGGPVHFLRFPFDDAALAAFLDAAAVEAALEDPAFSACAAVRPALLEQLKRDAAPAP